MSFYALAWLVVLLPLVGWFASFLAATPRRSAQITIAFCALAFLVAAVLLGYRALHQSATPYESVISFWEMRPVESGVFAATLTPMVGVRVDALSAALMAVAALIGLLVQWHGVVLMKADMESRRLFQVIALFTAAVLGLVAAPNLFQFWLLWEVLAVAAYVLAGHWWTSGEAAAAARRLFVHLWIGDLALFLGVVFTYVKFGPHASTQPAPPGSDLADPLSFALLSGSPGDPSHAGEWHLAHTGFVLGVGMRTLVLLGVLFLVAAAVRACLLPFHAWLGEAANAPPPVLALLASLVTATGVLLMARLFPLFLEVPHLLTVLALLGTATALFCAIAALVQRDLVRLAVLATAGQIGMVVAGLGMGGFSRALFALVITMLSTALLFLVVSNIVRAYRTQEIAGIAGMWSRMRWTSAALGAWAAGVSGASLVNYNILASTFHNTSPVGSHVGTVAKAAVAVGLAIAMAVTAICALRLAARLLGGKPSPRRGLQLERIGEGEPRLTRAMAAVGSVALLVVIVGSIPRLSFARFVYAGNQPQMLDWDVVASLTCLVVAAIAGLAARPSAASRVPSIPGVGGRIELLDVAPPLARLSSVVLARLGRTVAETDEIVIDGVAAAAGQGVMALGEGASRAVTSRLSVQLGVSLAAAAILVAGTVLAATGHLPGGL